MKGDERRKGQGIKGDKKPSELCGDWPEAFMARGGSGTAKEARCSGSSAEEKEVGRVKTRQMI